MDKQPPMVSMVKNYFAAPPGHFWNWDKESDIQDAHGARITEDAVIEWMGTNTICYQAELISILKALAPEGLPPLASILLVMTACSSPLLISTSTLHTILVPPAGEDRTSLVPGMALLVRVVELLQHISQLPAEYRSGSNKTLLLQIIFEGAPQRLGRDGALLLNLFNSGEYDELIYGGKSEALPAGGGAYPLRQRFRDELEAFEPALTNYTSTEALLQKLRTGLERVPTAAPVELPQLPPSNADLLTQLEEDENTAGLTRLTQRVMAALKIPMHAQGSSDQSFGGVSDITNRGNFDRLLLSELAYDDELLSARLANNEALYLRREELPSQRNKEWVILLDTTLKMWGVPRVFGMAAALACSHNNKGHASLQAYTLGNNSHQPLDLLSKAGIINGLGKMDTALHCGETLAALLEQQPRNDDRSFFLITNEQTLTAPAFQPALAVLCQQPGFIITTNRNGQLHCYELVNGRKKQIATALFDLDELLFAPAKKPHKKPLASRRISTANWPAIFEENPFPLRFPSSKVLMDGRFTVYLEDAGVLAVTDDQRLLYWDNRKKGAYEVMDFVEEGDYYFGFDPQIKKQAYLLIYTTAEQQLLLYKILLEEQLAVQTLRVRNIQPEVTDASFYLNSFYVRKATGTFRINATTAEFRNDEYLSETVLESIKKRNIFGPDVRRQVRNFINNGYSVLSTSGRPSINNNNELMIGNLVVDLHYDDRIKLRTASSFHHRQKRITAVEKHTVYHAPFNPQVKLQVFTWPDGSETITDSRGLLHLRSADKSIPEICIFLVLDQFTACWAADGTTCGNNYFILEDAEKYVGVGGQYFYLHYIKRFIDSLLSYAAHTTV